jgi:ankyrin repeat protein
MSSRPSSPTQTLVTAISNQDITLVQKLVSTQCHVSLTLVGDTHTSSTSTSTSEWSLLMMACSTPCAAIVDILLEHKSMTERMVQHSCRGDNAVTIAARSGHLEVVKSLLADDRINSHCLEMASIESGDTALMQAISHGHTDVVLTLLASVRCMTQDVLQQRNNSGSTALDIAVQAGSDASIVEAMLQHPTMTQHHIQHAAPKQGSSILVHALSHPELLQVLLADERVTQELFDRVGLASRMLLQQQVTADCDSDDDDDMTAAAATAAAVNLLLADRRMTLRHFEHCDLRQQTALMMIASKTHARLEVAQALLLDHRASSAYIHRTDEKGITAVHCAAASGNARILEAIVNDPRFDIDQLPKKDSILGEAIRRNHVSIVQYLQTDHRFDDIVTGPQVHRGGRRGGRYRTSMIQAPLIVACRYARPHIVSMILQHTSMSKTHVNMQDLLSKKNALMNAVACGNIDIVNILLADVRTDVFAVCGKNTHSQSALSIAQTSKRLMHRTRLSMIQALQKAQQRARLLVIFPIANTPATRYGPYNVQEAAVAAAAAAAESDCIEHHDGCAMPLVRSFFQSNILDLQVIRIVRDFLGMQE